MLNIEELKVKYRSLWWQCPSNPNLPLEKVSYFRKKKNEREFDEFIDNLIYYLNQFPKDNEKRVVWKLELEKYIDNFIISQKILKLELTDNKIKETFLESTKEFIRESRKFDDKMSYEDIGQAIRNLWIVNIFQKALGKNVEFTKGVFGYSMLYPYTDNYLDNKDVSIDEKTEFNEHFLERLKGENINARNSHEEKVFELISYIESQFPRNEYKDVYESLYSIYDGQERSLNQQESESIPYEKDILDISLEKGGASVLADGYLISGSLNSEEREFAYGYGFFLQLGDDLQDVNTDIENKHMTIVSQLANKYPLDKIASKILNLTIEVINNERCFINEYKKSLRELILNNCMYMMLFAIVDGSEYYSKEYIKIVTSYLPFSFEYCRSIKKKFKKKFKSVKLSYGETSIEDLVLYFID